MSIQTRAPRTMTRLAPASAAGGCACGCKTAASGGGSDLGFVRVEESDYSWLWWVLAAGGAVVVYRWWFDDNWHRLNRVGKRLKAEQESIKAFKRKLDNLK